MHLTNRIEGIQYVRGLAAIIVVFTHCNAMMAFPEYFGKALSPILGAGAYGVQIFFVISGFIITITSLRSDMSSTRGVVEFARNRFVRIIPLMWVCIIGYNLLSLVGTGAVEWPSFVRAMVLWPIGELKPNVIWTLRHEAIFYTVFALSLLLRKQRFYILFIWFLSPVIWQVVLIFIGDTPGPIRELATFIFNAANLHFGAGFTLGVLWLRHGHRWSRLKLSFPTTAILVIVGAALMWTAVGQPSQAPTNFVFSAIVSVAILGLALMPHKPSKIGMFLGEASYSIYLVHNAALLICLEIAAKVDFVLGWQWAMLLVFTAVAIIGGCLVHLMIERPLVRAFRKIMSQSSKAVA